jgi:hypothetical protein
LTRFDFGIFDGATGVGNVTLTRHTEALEASAAADAVDGDVAAVAFTLETLSHPLGQREDGGATSCSNVATHAQGIDYWQGQNLNCLLFHNSLSHSFNHCFHNRFDLCD